MDWATILWGLRSRALHSDNLELTDSTGTTYGRVSYFHAGGIDRPLSIWKSGVGSVLPHENWRGQFAMGIWGVGAVGSSGSLRGKRSDCPYGGAPDCIPLAWPGFSTNAWGKTSAQGGTTGDPTYWMGSLVNGMRDRTGQQYMRNRYYDPATGQFTQPDPIGLAGGLNAYGFAAGDPVTYSDPYGLKIKCNKAGCAILRRIIANARHAAASDVPSRRQAGEAVLGMIGELQSSSEVVTLTGQRFSRAHRWGRRVLGFVNATDATGPCRKADRYCPTGSEAAASRVDLDPPPFSAVGAETRAVHELGHAYTHVIGGVPWSGDSDQQAVDHENKYRTVKGCRHRHSHEPDAVNPPCMDH